MKVTKHIPPPVIPPPTTYDITGLSDAEARFIRYVVNYYSKHTGTPDGRVAAARFLNKLDMYGAPFDFNECFV